MARFIDADAMRAEESFSTSASCRSLQHKHANKHFSCGKHKRAAVSKQPNTPSDGSKDSSSRSLPHKNNGTLFS